MLIRHVALVLIARYKLALIVFLCTLVVALPVIYSLPREYSAAASLLVDIRSPDPISAILTPTNIATQEDIIRSERVALRVVKLLRLEENAGLVAQWEKETAGKGRLDHWLATRVHKRLVVIPPRRDSNIITLEYQSGDAGFAAAAANAFAQAYLDAVVELKVEPAKQYAKWFGEQGKALRENLEKAQARYSQFQREKGLVARDEQYDVETARLNELSAQLTAVLGQSAELAGKQRSGGDALPEVQQSASIVSLKNDLVRAETKLQEASGNLGVNHPQYQRMQAEIAALKRRLEVETRTVMGGYSASRSANRGRESELRAAVESQKRRILTLKQSRDQLAVLQRDVDAAQSAYEAVTKRYNQTSLESQATQTNVNLLTPATEPLTPSRPKIPQYTMMAFVLAIAFSVACALGLEMLDRRIRLEDDLRSLNLPVLIVVPNGTEQPRRLIDMWRRLPLPSP
jgi:succinoglycan biosynthesis transport protein ExoP